MRPPYRFALMAAGVLVSAACGSKKAPEQPAPAPAPTQETMPAPAPAPAPTMPAPAQPTGESAAAAAARITAAVLGEMATMVHFDFDQAVIRSDDRGLLDRKAEILSANGALRIRVSGHADDRGSDEYNLALGNRRAGAVKTYLVNKGIDGSRIEVVSYGEERPLAVGQDEYSWAQNRRAEFEATGGASNLRMP